MLEFLFCLSFCSYVAESSAFTLNLVYPSPSMRGCKRRTPNSLAYHAENENPRRILSATRKHTSTAMPAYMTFFATTSPATSRCGCA